MLISLIGLLFIIAVRAKCPLDPPYYIIAQQKDVYSLPVVSYHDNDMEPYFDFNTLLAHHWGDQDLLRKRMNKVLQQWRNEVRSTVICFSSRIE